MMPAEKSDSDARSDRRRDPRVLVDLEVETGNEDNYLFAYIRDLSTTGLFVRTTSPEAPGTRVNVRFSPGRREDILELEGEVIWVNPFRPSCRDNLHPGMGIRFISLTDELRERLTGIVTTFAYLSED
ncbi:MAG TPA: TIGR02266 family protein [Kofleriaceae bacterium]|nr:TIGR02266 family protein [Kofleriaceae bacterium]